MSYKFVANVLAALISTTAVAAAPTETVVMRQNNFKQMGRAQKAINEELRKSSPDVTVIRANTNTIANLAPQVTRWFPRGTGKGSGAKTGALPIIWQQAGRFNGSAKQFAIAARDLQHAATGGNFVQIRAAVAAVGGACKGCHDTFKGDK